jgi:thymidylate synthase (FAD)
MANPTKFTDEQLQEMTDARTSVYLTHRPTVPALEEMMFHPNLILDHGFLRCVDYMGNDAAVVQAARISYGRGTKKGLDDTNLIRYMVRHRHNSPIEMCEIKFHVKMPIFVARQWIRTRTASVNEVSARYSILDKEFYIPTADQLAVQSTTNRQGRGDTLTEEEALAVQNILRADAASCYDDYEFLLNDPTSPNYNPERSGLARELARMNLTLNTYTQWYWKIDLHNLGHFLGLRADSHAQYEIRVYAEKMLDFVKAWVPDTYQAFVDYKFEAKTLSRMEVNLVRDIIKGYHVANEKTADIVNVALKQYMMQNEKLSADEADKIIMGPGDVSALLKQAAMPGGVPAELELRARYGMGKREVQEFLTNFVTEE